MIMGANIRNINETQKKRLSNYTILIIGGAWSYIEILIIDFIFFRMKRGMC